MHAIKGATSCPLPAAQVAAWAAGFSQTALDLGAGDGRFVRKLAERHEDRAAIALDLCAANYRAASRAASQNALFLVADALHLPAEWSGLADEITINFPWGSLLRGLLDSRSGLPVGLARTARPNARVRLIVNAGALAQENWRMETGANRVAENFAAAGFSALTLTNLGPKELRRYPSTWAKRLAFGRDPRAVTIEAAVPA